MRKVIVLSALLLITGMSVYAQEDYSKSLKTTTTIVENADKYKVETNRFWSNWFVTAGGGGLIFFGDHNMQMKFGDRHWTSVLESGLPPASVYASCIAD